MTATYKDDESFFATVFPPFIHYGFCVKNWFATSGISKFRFIRDEECERQFWNLEQINSMYPGIKTITIVVNPWSRMKYAYDSLCYMKQHNDNTYFDSDLLSEIPLDKFKNFIAALPDMVPVDPFWFSLATPLNRWIEYNDNGVMRQVDYILREGHIAEDFKPIQDFFCSGYTLDAPSTTLDYRKFYTKSTAAQVEKIFQEEIVRFNHSF
jgi:hypothetical protein